MIRITHFSSEEIGVISKKMTIPKIIHQMWLDVSNPTIDTVPEKRKIYQPFIQKIKDFHPNYQYMWWNLESVRNLFRHPKVAKYAETFERLPNIIMKCDFSRYAILYMYGGYYFDLDTIFFNPMPDNWTKEELGLFQEPPTMSGGLWPELEKHTGYTSSIHNGTMFSSVENPIWLAFLDEVKKLTEDRHVMGVFDDVINITGPKMFTRVVVEQDYGKYVKSPCYFFALTSDGTPIKLKDGNSFCTQDDLDQAVASNDWSNGTNWALNELDIHAYDLFKFIVLATILCIFVYVCYKIHIERPYFQPRSDYFDNDNNYRHNIDYYG